jgi:hypothetical protein
MPVRTLGSQAPAEAQGWISLDSARARTAVRAAAAVAIGVSISQIILSVAQLPWQPPDTEAYWQAALRLRAGEPLYVATDELLARDIYRYAPWFAYAWVPLTHLPKDVVEVAWKVVMVACTAVAMLPLLTLRTFVATAVALLLGWLTLQTALYGNVHPLLIAGLVWTVDRRSGPVWIAIAASLKFVPIVYVIVYAARGEWRRFGVAVSLTLVLVAPMMAFDLSAYTTTPAASASLYGLHPALWAVVAVAGVGVAYAAAARKSRFTWSAASVAVYLAYPQAFVSYASHLLVGSREAVEERAP